jgi:recombinational DNA repair protein RecR
MALLKLRATADPGAVLYKDNNITVRADSRGNVVVDTQLKITTWADDRESDTQLFVVGDDVDTWPVNQSQHADVNYLLIHNRLRVLETKSRKTHKVYTIATSAEPGTVND